MKLFPRWLGAVAALLVATLPVVAATPEFADFDRRAAAGEALSVVFFGASLTWGANASDPQLTSYRALVARKLEAAYPRAHFHFWDAAIGGTGSQLGVFRFERDVLRRQPDLVFLDFSANDGIEDADPEKLASYESLVRRIIVEAHAPVVPVIFPFKWNVIAGDLSKMPRHGAHLALAQDYHTVAGDAISLAIERVRRGETTLAKIWEFDGVHPGDAGYALFADAAWAAFREGVAKKLVCAAPAKMRYEPTYLTNARVPLASLGALPAGWHAGLPNRVSAYYDMLMSRWLDSEAIASNRLETTDEKGKKTKTPQTVERLKLRFMGSMVLLFGEGTMNSVRFHAYLDGRPVEHLVNKVMTTEFDAGRVARPSNGNTHSVELIAQGLDPEQEHSLEIELLLPEDGREGELRLESICVAGGSKPGVRLAP